MPQFHYQATTPQGKIIKGVMDVGAERVVVSRLHDQGYLPLKIHLPDQTTGKLTGLRLTLPVLPGQGRVRQRDLLLVTQELATLLSAGLPLDRALSVLTGLTNRAELRQAVEQILRHVQRGKSLAEALAEYPKIFPPLYINMIKAGELGGFLDTALARLAEYLERAQEVQDEVKSALAYPTILLSVGGAAIVLMFTFVLPKFAVLFEDMGEALPAATRLLLAVSYFVRDYWGLMALSVAACGAGLWRYVASPQGRLAWDGWSLRLAFIGPLLQKREVGRFARTLGTLLQSGVPLLQAMELVEEVVGNQRITRSLTDARVGVREGEGIAAPLGQTGVFPSLALQMVSVGEETGRLDEMLMQVAEYYEKDTHNQLRRLTSLVEPVLLLTMGLIVGFVVIAMLLGLFSVNNVSF